MDLLKLRSKKGARHAKKRVGRGNGSGHGTYSSRGMKGQNSRSGGRRRPGFEGGQTPLIRKLPKLKGFKSIKRINYSIINLKDLNVFEDGAKVDKEALYKKGLIGSLSKPVKLLGNGDLQKKLTVYADAAANAAKEKLEKAGSKLELPPPRQKAS
ncbi:50S ribosomal protein L15 [Candidatus Peregrinibacteria bacterium]|nr:50S ribosomal protein L15 [Candidatus Peregrinibacteria bacterium]